MGVTRGATSPEDVHEELGRVLASRGFAGSVRMQRFLRYIVEQALAGRTGELKEYTIALEVFDRTAEYNPKVDAIVRVEARRLRAKLAEYYEREGAADRLRIELPTGSYAPVFHPARAVAVRSWRRVIAAGVVLGAVATVAAISMYLARGRNLPRPEVVRLVRDAAFSTEPVVTADGKLLAYSSDQSGNFDIWIRRLDTNEARRLTSHEATESEPDISPDGSRIVFRSERGGGGLYVAPVFGGEERLLSTDGRSPRFSPDGKLIVYWVGSPYFPGARSFVVSSDGSSAKQIAADVQDARTPVWSPDGNRVLVQTVAPNRTEVEYSVAYLDGQASRSTGWRAAVAEAGLGQMRSRPAWHGTMLYFAALPSSRRPSGAFTGISQEVVNIWRVRLDPGTGRVSGTPEQVTYGAGSERSPVVTGTGQLIYAAVQYSFTAAYLLLNDREGTVPLANLIRRAVARNEQSGHWALRPGMTIHRSGESAASGERQIVAARRCAHADQISVQCSAGSAVG